MELLAPAPKRQDLLLFSVNQTSYSRDSGDDVFFSLFYFRS